MISPLLTGADGVGTIVIENSSEITLHNALARFIASSATLTRYKDVVLTLMFKF